MRRKNARVKLLEKSREKRDFDFARELFCEELQRYAR
jgi:hypothetical protein